MRGPRRRIVVDDQNGVFIDCDILTLLDHLLSTEECPAGLVLLVDEAQSLSTALLDELRVLTNLVHGGVPRVRLVLAGSSALEEAFAHPDLESFSQRLGTRCYLAPFGRDDTARFIQAQVAASGAVPHEIFADNAWDAVFEATDGIPRLVNQLCDRAMSSAVENNKSFIDRDCIQRAWADLQQLPSPWDTPAKATIAAATGVVEFGTLSAETISEIGLADDLELDEFIEITSTVPEPTELDTDDSYVISNSSHPVVANDFATAECEDPFAEEFDEEEVVLDNFAAWDDVLRQSATRVQNRRDPGFANLVQSAIEASPTQASESKLTGAPSVSQLAEREQTNNTRPLPAPAEIDWPPLRLAIVSDAAPQDQLDIEPPATTSISKYAAAFEQMLQQHETSDWTASLAPGAAGQRTENIAIDEDPILIIDDDSTPRTPQPPVRREEYRNLFSRLRSG